MTQVDMIAIDLDDTLLRDDISVSDYTKDVMKRAVQKGIRVVIATGRMFQAARPWGEALGVGDVPIIVYTGALIATCGTGRILYHDPINLEEANRVLAVGRSHRWYMQAYVNDRLLVPWRDSRTVSYERACGVQAVVAGDDFWKMKEAPTKLLVFEKDPQVMEEAEQCLKKTFGKEIGYVKSKPYFFEMNRPETTKGRALEMLCLRWGIPLTRVMTFGNSENDISMLSVTPWSFAVENAEPAARQAARFVTASNNEDGVAKAVEKYVLNE